MNPNRIIEMIESNQCVYYDADHDIGVDFAWIDKQLFELCKAQQEQIDNLEYRIEEIEKKQKIDRNIIMQLDK